MKSRNLSIERLKRQKGSFGRKSKCCFGMYLPIDTFLFMSEVTIVLHATFQLSDNNCTLMHLEVISSGNNLLFILFYLFSSLIKLNMQMQIRCHQTNFYKIHQCEMCYTAWYTQKMHSNMKRGNKTNYFGKAETKIRAVITTRRRAWRPARYGSMDCGVFKRGI